MIIVAGTFEVSAKDRASFLDSTADMVMKTRQESGCRSYVFSLEPNNDTTVHLFEIWDTQKELSDHLDTQHVNDWYANEYPKFNVVSKNVLKHLISKSGPVLK